MACNPSCGETIGYMQLPRVALVNDVAGVAQVEMEILKGAGFEVDFYELPLLGASWPAIAKALALPVRLAAYLPVIRKLRRGNYQLLHIHFVSQGVVGLAVGKPFFIHAHGSDLHANFKNPLKRALSLLVLRRARGIFYVTPNLRTYLEPFAQKAHLLGNPLDISLFPPRRTISTISEVLIFTRLDQIKGVDRIFERAPELAALVNLTTIAWGPLTGDYAKRYAPFVRFIAPVPHNEIPTLLQQFDAVVGQMGQGVLGLSELEALGAGRIVFANLDVKLYPDDPPPVVDIKDGGELVRELRSLMGNPDQIQALSQAGPHWVERHHSPQKHLEGLRREYLRA